MSLRELSLFSGAGGGLLGTMLLGWNLKACVEFNPYAQRVLQQRMDDGVIEPAPIFDDVRDFDGLPWRGLVDVVTGGFPCQPHSKSGLQRGLDDPRDMWPQTIRIIREVRPRLALLENVPGLLASDAFGVVLGGLAEAGYDAAWTVRGAADVGAPHRRDRLWILATRQDPAAGEARRVDGGDGVCLEWGPGRCVVGRRDRPALPGRVGEGLRLPDADRDRLQGQRQGRPAPRNAVRVPRGVGWWEREPGLGRLADGVPDRAHRIRAAGNGQVPAVVVAAFFELCSMLGLDVRALTSFNSPRR